jgi:3-deoxy-manno-octulosonate cytidylyltransferase (CMP-KDO synthetase)
MVSQFLGIIPARYASSRFPGKALAMLGEKPMIQWVYEGASEVFENLVVATDDKRIMEEVNRFGGNVVKTSNKHPTGTDRCAEAYRKYGMKTGLEFSHIVNIQGDEPLLKAKQLQSLLNCFHEPGTEIATLIRPLKEIEEVDNPNCVKVVVDTNLRALYFSRSAIPFVRDHSTENWITQHPYYGHIGLYAFRSEILEKIVDLAPSSLEQAESLEQLRWLENGFQIQTQITHIPSLGVDTPEDLERISRLI